MAKQHGHEKAHAHCEHCLHFCGHCDVVYCCDCKIEWGKCHHYYPYQWTWTTPTYTGTGSDISQGGTTTYGTSDTVTTTTEACSHAHN